MKDKNPNALDDAVYGRISERRMRQPWQKPVRLAKSRLPKVRTMAEMRKMARLAK